MIPRRLISLGILAGGQGQRLGGVDKAAVEFRGQALLARTLHALGRGFAETLVSRPYGVTASAPNWRAVPDLRPGFSGPLGGIEALLVASSSPWLLTLPVDLRDIPADICERLSAVANATGAAARDAAGLQPLVALWPVALAKSAVAGALDRGERAVHRLVTELRLEELDVSPFRFGNLNTPADFDEPSA